MPRLLVEGDCLLNHSLSLCNARLALCLEQRGWQVAIKQTGRSRFPEPLPADLDVARIEQMVAAGETARPDIVLRSNYPPGLAPAAPGVPLVAWQAIEWTPAPTAWIGSYNRHADAVLAMSTYNARALLSSGLEVPCYILPPPLDPIFFADGYESLEELGDTPEYRYLYVGGLCNRKGTDIILRSFCDVFAGNQHVRLVLKTSPAYSAAGVNQCAEVLAKAGVNHAIIHQTLTNEELRRLYASCDCLVYPTRGEGFGLGVAEALACGLDVVAPSHTGLADYFDKSLGHIVASKPLTMPAADFVGSDMAEEFGLTKIIGQEPDYVDWCRKLLAALAQRKPTATIETARAALGRFTSQQVAKDADEILRSLLR